MANAAATTPSPWVVAEDADPQCAITALRFRVMSLRQRLMQLRQQTAQGRAQLGKAEALLQDSEAVREVTAQALTQVTEVDDKVR